MLAEVPLNAEVLEFCRRHSARAPSGQAFVVDGWETHAHPDLAERLFELAPDEASIYVYGVLVVARRGVAAALAFGADRRGMASGGAVP